MRDIRVYGTRDDTKAAIRLQNRHLGVGNPPVRNGVGQRSFYGQYARGGSARDEEGHYVFGQVRYLVGKSEEDEINMIKKILRVKPGNRPTIEEILEHPYCKQPK